MREKGHKSRQGAHFEIGAVRERVHVVIDLGIVLQFAEIIAGVVKFIERNAQAPDVAPAVPLMASSASALVPL